MNKIVLSFTGVFMLMLTGCNTGENIQNFPAMPAIVDFYSSMLQPKIITPYGVYSAPILQSAMFTELDDGDAIWTMFSVNYDQQPSTSEHYMVSEMQWFKVEKAYPTATPGGEGAGVDFNLPIESMEATWRVEDVIFFIFIHAPSDQKYTYEMTYDSENPEVVFIRAKNEGAGSRPSESSGYPYVFDMHHYFTSFPHYSENLGDITFRYKTGVDEEGKDVYNSWKIPQW